MAECGSVDVETLKQLKQRRAGFLSDVTKKRTLCEKAFVDGSSLAVVKDSIRVYEQSFMKFVTSHEEYLEMEANTEERKKAITAYESHRDALLHMQTDISSKTKLSLKSKTSQSKSSQYSVSASSSKLEMKRREAEIMAKA